MDMAILSEKEYWEVYEFKLRMITPPEWYDEAVRLLRNIPKSYHKFYMNMITQGLTPQDSYELLKDTYEF